jgi:hypothetical protein
MGQQRRSEDVCVTSVMTAIAALKRTFGDFAFVPNTDIAGFPSPDLKGGCVVAARKQFCGTNVSNRPLTALSISIKAQS